LGPKFIGNGLSTIVEDFSNNPNHEDQATVGGGVDASEAQGERLFTHIPSAATPVHVNVLDRDLRLVNTTFCSSVAARRAKSSSVGFIPIMKLPPSTWNGSLTASLTWKLSAKAA
jgi:hypothetical protein